MGTFQWLMSQEDLFWILDCNDKDDVTKIHEHPLVMSKYCVKWEQNVSRNNQESINEETINIDKKLSTLPKLCAQLGT